MCAAVPFFTSSVVGIVVRCDSFVVYVSDLGSELVEGSVGSCMIRTVAMFQCGMWCMPLILDEICEASVSCMMGAVIL